MEMKLCLITILFSITGNLNKLTGIGYLELSGLDRLLASSLEATIKKHLGEDVTKKIEKRLFEKYGINLTQAIEDFQKIDVILREFFAAGADGLEKKFLQDICKVKSKKAGANWFTIEDESVAKVILEAYGDDDKVKIINSVPDLKPNTIKSIMLNCNGEEKVLLKFAK